MFKRILIHKNLIQNQPIKIIQKKYVKICSKPDLTSIPNLKRRLLTL